MSPRLITTEGRIFRARRVPNPPIVGDRNTLLKTQWRTRSLPSMGSVRGRGRLDYKSTGESRCTVTPRTWVTFHSSRLASNHLVSDDMTFALVSLARSPLSRDRTRSGIRHVNVTRIKHRDQLSFVPLGQRTVRFLPRLQKGTCSVSASFSSRATLER